MCGLTPVPAVMGRSCGEDGWDGDEFLSPCSSRIKAAKQLAEAARTCPDMRRRVCPGTDLPADSRADETARSTATAITDSCVALFLAIHSVIATERVNLL